MLSCVSLATLRSSMPWSRFCSSWASLSRQSSSSSSVSSLPTRPPDAVQRPVWILAFRVRILDHSGVCALGMASARQEVLASEFALKLAELA